ncbi:MipA/OmpV family protein [Amphritea japonica]|uniref:MltA-interacting MipA family protein n=1 Tax=Amphritea japonica ATCC BAA-1530 TaxID=1278309 RepID=A0A7R6SS35_9GAMM|nr:MipA/OmpV family protein [Amphritea japonica]BBB25904.1 MltA-interacting MipA family protein [Amphritea japonica ATCC BAA-1530]
MKHTLLPITAAVILSCSALSVAAGEFTIGAGGSVFKSPYKDFKDDSAPLLFVEYQGEDLSVGLDGISYRVMGNDNSPLSLYATLASVGEGFDSGDSTFFSGMSDRDTSVDLGVTAAYQIGEGAVSGSLLHDVSDTHNGFVADVSYSHGFEIAGKAYLTPAAGIVYMSEDYADYYFGVRDSEATANRAAYKADAAFNPYVGVEMIVPMGESWQLVSNANYIWLGDEVEQSSIVDRDNAWSATLGLAYTF